MTAPSIDWPAVHAEALAVLRDYLRINTSNPPGNEAPAARFLGRLLTAEGIGCEFIETAPGREAVVARLRGDGSRGGALMLANHLDTVPAEADGWASPPFVAEVRNGRVYGRGAVDMKGTGVMQLFATILAKRRGISLGRDIVFLAAPDEETGSAFGVEWLTRHRPDLFDGVDFALNEGASGMPEFAGRAVHLFEVAVAEKMMAPLRLVATGTPGHGSKPARDSATVRLLSALDRLRRWERGITYTPETRAYLERLYVAGLIDSLHDDEAIEVAIGQSPDTVAAFTNTLNVTVLRAGSQSNVIPGRAEALVDCRLLPGQSREAWVEAARAVVDDPLVEVAFEWPNAAPEVSSPWDTEVSRVITEVLTAAFEDAVVVPSWSIVGTDNRFTRPLGIPSYGFIPCLLSQAERDGFHAHDEFLTVDNLNLGVEVMSEVVRRLCEAR